MGDLRLAQSFAPVLALALFAGAAHAAPPDDARTMRVLDLAFGTKGPLPESPPTATPAERARTFRAFVQDRMKQDAFYQRVLGRFFGVFGVYTDMVPFELQKKSENGREVYFLDKPCPVAEQVQVKPWWDVDHPVWVCKDSYRPDLKVDARAGAPQYCERANPSYTRPDPICRCGEHLLNCARDREQHGQVNQSIVDELRLTFQHVIQSHQPITNVLTMRETVRSDLAELFYARSRFYKTGKLGLAPVDPKRPPSLRDRDPEYAGGVLTTPLYLYLDAARRITISMVWDDFLCTPLSARSAVHAPELFTMDAGTASGKLRATEFTGLITKVGCRDCHARIENAVRAFKGWTQGSIGMRYLPADVYQGHIDFFVRDSGDKRAEGPPTPLWLGQTIAAQPELNACMVRKVEDFVWGGYDVPADVDTLLKQRFAASRDLAATFEDAVVARHVGLAGVAASSAPAPTGGAR